MVSDVLDLSLQCSQLISELFILYDNGRSTLKQARRCQCCDAKLENVYENGGRRTHSRIICTCYS